MKTNPNLKTAFAVEEAVKKAKAYFGESYEHYEVWETYPNEVIIRAWDNTDDADYAFFTQLINS